MSTLSMSTRSAAVAGTVLIAALAGAPALAGVVYYSVAAPGLGSGYLTYDDAVLQDVGGGLCVSPLTDFSFVFNGATFSLADAADPWAWLADPDLALLGIQYLGTAGGSEIEFAAGFGAGDLGSFTANAGTPDQIGPIALGNSDFVRGATDMPAPGSLACLLAGLGAGAGGAAKRRIRARGG